ncbi:hypothetical protein LZC95_43220 [Pendulispora brunnea]|uniref:DUF1801 domain-containing protein n=1 Tax=Pendulispora brunnea TaxID=2905690 RepID=A0ABZ2K3P5_9BACT
MRRDPAELFAVRKKKPIPFEFVLEELDSLGPWTRPMFGCTAVYVEEKIMFILRDKKKDADNGVWVATTKEHHASLRRELPSLRSISVLGPGETGWQMLPVDSDDFEESVLRACAMVRKGDPRIGKVPGAKKKKKSPGPGKGRSR